ncbi:MAG: hypothetical protein K2K02_02450, partial [Ruminococcus sp.]|nr:hypothetical protein [Ruminococcus sp.]
ALISAVMLAVCAVPMGAGAEYLMGDMNRNGVIDEEDGNLLVEYWQWGKWDENTSEEEHEFYKTYGDMNGDGKIYNDDIILFNEICIKKDSTINTEMGDVNHDGYVDYVDSSLIMLYYADLSTDKYDKYTEEQHENMRTYGDMNNDGYVNAMDASLISIRYNNKKNNNFMGDMNRNGVIDEEDGKLLVDYWQYRDYEELYTAEDHKFYKTYGDMNGDGRIDHDDIKIFNEICIESDVTLNTEIGDVNHDGYVNAIDASLVLIYYAEISTGNEDKYTEAQHENFRIYGDICDMGDGFINASDATAILMIYAERATSVFPTIE